MRFRWPVLVLVALAAPTFAHAQFGEGRRSGLTAAIGAGVGSAGIACVPTCEGERQSGPSGLVRVGGSLTPQFILAGEANIFVNKVHTSQGDGTWMFSFLTLVAMWYPSEDEDYFIKGGLGIATLRAETPLRNLGPDRLDTSDLGVVFGVGQDIPITGRFSVTPYLDYMFSPRSSAVINRHDAGLRMSGDVIYVGLAFTMP